MKTDRRQTEIRYSQSLYDYLFKVFLYHFIIGIVLRYKNGTRKSLTFTNERMREIERENYILLQKIMSCSNGPSKSHFSYNVRKSEHFL